MSASPSCSFIIDGWRRTVSDHFGTELNSAQTIDQRIAVVNLQGREFALGADQQELTKFALGADQQELTKFDLRADQQELTKFALKADQQELTKFALRLISRNLPSLL